MVTYTQSSPYFKTGTNGQSLDILNFREIPKEADDVEYIIRPHHAYRPDLLAADLYGDDRLWWVFAARNPNTLEDPIFDFKPGLTIRLPKLTTLSNALGI